MPLLDCSTFHPLNNAAVCLILMEFWILEVVRGMRRHKVVNIMMGVFWMIQVLMFIKTARTFPFLLVNYYL